VFGTRAARTGGPQAQHAVTRQLVEALEWGGLAFQGAVLIQTAFADPFSTAAQAVVLALGAGHLVLAFLAWRAKGPIGRGGWLLGAWLAGALVVPVVIALLAAHGTYGSSTACVPGCTYPSAPVFFVAIYPWIVAPALPRRVIELGLLGAVCLEWLLLTYAINGTLTRTTGLSVVSSVLLALVAYGLGKVESVLTGVVRRSQIEAEQHKSEEFFNFLHSHIKAGLAAVKVEQPDVAAMLDKVGELERTVSEQRITQLLSMDRIPLASLCSERLRTFTGVIALAETPRMGAQTVTAPVGMLIERTLGDLLKNAVVHGAATAWVSMGQGDGMLILEIADDGPGFDDAVMENTGTSLYRLRASARELGGDLTRMPRPPRGSRLILSVRTAGNREEARRR
jgi:histidine kinase/DNA gyrase B/HSP90-like ATPase